MYVEVCFCVSCRLQELPVDSLCGHDFVGVLELFLMPALSTPVDIVPPCAGAHADALPSTVAHVGGAPLPPGGISAVGACGSP